MLKSLSRRAALTLLATGLVVGLGVATAGCEPAKIGGLPEPGPNASEITVTTEPPGATIVIDGTPLGAGPVKAKLNPGMHTLKATKTGYFPADQKLSVSSADKGKQVVLTLVASH